MILKDCKLCSRPVRARSLGRAASGVEFDFMGLRRGGNQFDFCAHCSVLFMNPQPTEEELSSLYSGSYWEKKQTLNSHKSLLQKQFRRALVFARELERSGVDKDGRILEIGSGFGGVCWALGQLLKMEPVAMEPDPVARDFQKALGVTILEEASIKRMVSGGHRFDVVILSHVLEHVLDPRDLVRQAFLMVKPSGTVLIEVPHGNFVIDGSIQHPFVFTRYALESLLAAFNARLTFRAHSGPENILMPPTYLLGIAHRKDSKEGQRVLRFRVPLLLMLCTQAVTLILNRFPPLTKANQKFGAARRRAVDSTVHELFEALPQSARAWAES